MIVIDDNQRTAKGQACHSPCVHACYDILEIATVYFISAFAFELFARSKSTVNQPPFYLATN